MNQPLIVALRVLLWGGILAAGFYGAVLDARQQSLVSDAFTAETYNVRAAVCQEHHFHATGLWLQNGTRGFLPMIVLDTFHLTETGAWVPNGLSCSPDVAVFAVYRNIASVSRDRLYRHAKLISRKA